MMQLTINPNSHPKVISFNKPIVIIGSGAPAEADLSLSNENLQSIHIKIIEQNGRFTIINVANDPFVTLNSLPFGKKSIKSNDIIQVGSTTIQFNCRTAESPQIMSHIDREGWPSEEDQYHPVPLNKNANIHEALERTIANVRNEDGLSNDELDDLMREVESLSSTKSFNPPVHADKASEIETPDSECETIVAPSPTLVSPSIEQVKTPSELDESSAYEGDESPSYYDEKANNGEQPRNWNFIILLILGVLLIGSLITIKAYVTISDKSELEKIAAAEGVSDIAMALTYAQVSHIKPQKQNWSDPEFLRTNLSSVLSPEYPSFANIDSQGQLKNCPYMLRIYTSNDLSRFLVIAQPEPSLLQWLIPKTAIIVDSKAMEMRNISDLKAINRLLLNPNTLDDSNSTEISVLVQQGTIIPLSSLAEKSNNPGFSPPKVLSLIHPGAENLIYNAPRYYHFGESLLLRATTLLQNMGNSYEVVRFRQELAELSKHPQLILYTGQGLQKAFQAQKALATLVPGNKILTGYLNFDAKGILTNSQLLLNDEVTAGGAALHKAAMELHSLQSNNPGHLPSEDKNIANLEQSVSAIQPLKFDGGVDHNHPLFLQLTALNTERQKALKGLSDGMVELLKTNTEASLNEFPTKFLHLLKRYRIEEKQQSKKITESLKDLYSEYNDIPIEQFTIYVKAAGLEEIARISLINHAKINEDLLLTHEQFNVLKEKVQRAKDLTELESEVTIASEVLNLHRVPDAYLLIKYENEMHALILQRLRQFIMSANNPSISCDASNRQILTKILNKAWMNDPNEYEYYIQEFDLQTPMLSYISLPIVDMFEKPDMESKIVSQSFYSEKVKVIQEQNNWALIETADNTSGWVKKSAFYQSNKVFPDPESKFATVNRNSACIFDITDTDFDPLMSLPYESKVEVVDNFGDPNGRWLQIRLVDGNIAFIQRCDIELNPRPLTIDEMVIKSRNFLGIPYSSAGRCSFGYDSSGFVQMNYHQLGIILPRELQDQLNWNGFSEANLQDLKPGDLVFFGQTASNVSHVGMYIGNSQFIHSEKQSHVRISSLNDADWSETGLYPYRAARTLKK